MGLCCFCVRLDLWWQTIEFPDRQIEPHTGFTLPGFADIMSETKGVQEVSRLTTQINQQLESKSCNVKKCLSALSQIKIKMLDFDLLPPFNPNQAVAKSELTAARSALETAVKLSVNAEDMAMFARHYAQLKTYYFDYSALLTESKQQWNLVGLNLMHLLAANTLSDFHTELE